ncbi:MAG: Putative signal transduction protein with CBS domain [Thermotogales bacterium 46_20]|nr:MAG: Putative signal transduction protein with CBS domain [Thermotogales bacterium 46_20]
MMQPTTDKSSIDSLLEKLGEYFADMPASELMNPNVLTMSKDRTLWHTKELMRIRKISGVPIVDQKRRLIGLVSIEDIIVALENELIGERIEKHMTRRVVTVAPDETLTSVVAKFNRYRFGRFPVVNSEGTLLGIITKKDIIGAILERFRLMYVHDERRKSALEGTTEWFEKSLISGDYVEKDSANFAFNIDYTDVDMVGIGAAELKKFLIARGLDEQSVRRISIATYEAEVNVVIHSGSEGTIYCWMENGKTVKVRVEDTGKGIENIEQALKEGYSTASDHVRELGFGAGMGLSNMRRCSDKMMVMSEVGKGVVVEMIFEISGGKKDDSERSN